MLNLLYKHEKKTGSQIGFEIEDNEEVKLAIVNRESYHLKFS